MPCVCPQTKLRPRRSQKRPGRLFYYVQHGPDAGWPTGRVFFFKEHIVRVVVADKNRRSFFPPVSRPVYYTPFFGSKKSILGLISLLRGMAEWEDSSALQDESASAAAAIRCQSRRFDLGNWIPNQLFTSSLNLGYTATLYMHAMRPRRRRSADDEKEAVNIFARGRGFISEREKMRCSPSAHAL